VGRYLQGSWAYDTMSRRIREDILSRYDTACVRLSPHLPCDRCGDAPRRNFPGLTYPHVLPSAFLCAQPLP